MAGMIGSAAGSALGGAAAGAAGNAAGNAAGKAAGSGAGRAMGGMRVGDAGSAYGGGFEDMMARKSPYEVQQPAAAGTGADGGISPEQVSEIRGRSGGGGSTGMQALENYGYQGVGPAMSLGGLMSLASQKQPSQWTPPQMGSSSKAYRRGLLG